MGQQCRERGNGDADGKRDTGSPRRELVARCPHTEHDADHHQHHAHRRSPRRVVRVGHIETHRGDGEAEGDKGECLDAVHHSGFHACSVNEAAPRVLTKP
jgi:hypothetical protein